MGPLSLRREVFCGSFGKAQARDDAQVRHVVLEDYQHYGRQRHDPKQGVAELRARREVRGPVAGVYEADGHEKPRADVFQQFERGRARFVVLFEKIEYLHGEHAGADMRRIF